MSIKLDELIKAKEEALNRRLKAQAEWHIAETFVDLAEDADELVKAKVQAYDARNGYDQALSEYLKASEAETDERWNLYYLEEVAAGRVQPDKEPVAVTDEEFPF